MFVFFRFVYIVIFCCKNKEYQRMDNMLIDKLLDAWAYRDVSLIKSLLRARVIVNQQSLFQYLTFDRNKKNTF